MRRALFHISLLGAVCFAALTGGAQPVITNQPANQTAILGGSATFSVMATGVGPFTYQWQLNGTNCNTNGIISTLAGGAIGFSGDGSASTNAQLFFPYGVAADSIGNFYIADTFNHRIRKVNTNGIITTVAGNGTAAFAGDGGTATNASLNQPYAVAADSFGNLFIADYRNNRIRKVDTNGVITTVAGGGAGGDGGYATNALIQGAAGVAVDTRGNLFIADLLDNRIRKVDTNGIISTVAGSGTAPGGGFSGDGGAATNAKLSLPYGVALDNSGNLFVSDHNNARVRKVDTNGIITTVAGNGSYSNLGDGGAATNASVSPQGIFVDTFGYIYIADYGSDRIRQVDANGIITTIAGGSSGPIGDGGYATNATVYGPEGVALDNSGNLLIADTSNNRIRKVLTGRNPVLTLNNVTANSAGNYQVIVTGTNGSVTSSNASLTLLFPPSITTQPTNAKAVYGSSAGFNVTVSGNAPFAYQWFTSSGRDATAVPIVLGGRVFATVIFDPGAGYTSVPQVHFIGGSGSGAAGTAIVIGGMVIFINLTIEGSGYTAAPPIIQIDPPSTINAALSGQTNATLALPAVTSANATNYFVVVTNNYGSVTSATVLLTVFLPPQNFAAQNLLAGLQLQLTGTPNYPYILQSATNLTPPISWQSIRTNYADTNGNWQFTDTNLNGSQKYYRALGQ